MTPNEYQRLAMTTLNSSLEKKDILINGVMGLCGEAGEAIDIVKKHLAETATALDVSLEEVLQGNIRKLKKRYPEGFSVQDSKERDRDDL